MGCGVFVCECVGLGEGCWMSACAQACPLLFARVVSRVPVLDQMLQFMSQVGLSLLGVE